MRRICILKAVLAAIALLTVLMSPVFADNGKGNNGNGKGDGGPRGAPGPVLGAGLPVLAVGYGVYWVVRRRKKASQPSNG
jgi:hypothetical protein